MRFVPKELHETADISRGRAGFKEWVKSVVSVLLVLIILYLGIGLIADLVVYNISEETEASWFSWTGRGAFGKKDQGGEEFERARRIFHRLVEFSELRPLPYKLFAISLDKPNAAALPGGAVGVTSSLLKEVTSEKGLAMVLAHELGHHQYRHCLRRLGRTVLFRLALFGLLGESGTPVLQFSLEAAEAGYSRDQERQADRFGLELVHEVYGDTDGCLEFFELVRREYERGNSSWDRLLGGHPVTSERIEYLRRRQTELRQGE